jgi:hypothetical protein
MFSHEIKRIFSNLKVLPKDKGLTMKERGFVKKIERFCQKDRSLTMK